MKNIKFIPFIAVLVIAALSCNFLSPTSNKDGVVPGDLNQIEEIPTYDPAAPLPSPGAASLRALAVLEPGVAELESDVEAAERAALTALFAQLQAKLSASNDIELPLQALQSEGVKAAIPILEFSFPVNYNVVGEFDGDISTANDAGLITGVLSGWNDLMTPNVLQTGAATNGSVTESENDATTTSSANLGRNTDGSTSFGFGSKTEVTKNGVSATTEVAASLDGQRCPNSEGQVSFTVKLRLSAISGGAGYTQELTAFVRAVVNDDSTISSTTFDITQGTRQAKQGHEVYVETGETIKYKGDDVAGLVTSNVRMIRHSQDATQADASSLSSAGHDATFKMALTALRFAENNWLAGGCTKIVATSPGNVQTDSTTEIPVTVIHRFDGSEVPSKLEATLSGGQSVDPTSLAKTPGTLTYTAPNEVNKSATITLTATSRRGRAILELNASTGGAAYQVVGGAGDWQTDSAVCDIMQPFTLTGGGFTMQMSGGLSGTYTYTGPYGAHGGDSYTISLPDGVGKPGTMTGGGVGCVNDGGCKDGTEFYTLTPLDPATGCSQ